MLPLVNAPESVLPDARLPDNVPRSKPAPRKPVPAPESVTEKGVPDWKMVMPLKAQSFSKAALTPVVSLKIGKS